MAEALVAVGAWEHVVVGERVAEGPVGLVFLAGLDGHEARRVLGGAPAAGVIVMPLHFLQRPSMRTVMTPWLMSMCLPTRPLPQRHLSSRCPLAYQFG
jgi:hypothetical protein